MTDMNPKAAQFLHGDAEEMQSAATDRFARSVLRRCALTVGLALAACTTSPEIGQMGADVGKSTMQFSVARLDRLWTAAPGTLIMVQRGNSAQIVGLENETTLPGDNFIWLYANGGAGAQVGGRLKLEQVIARAGGVPAPFTAFDNRNLRSGSDSFGQYFWQEYRSGAQTNCVLAVRQLKNGARALPRGTRALEVVLRNCVNGSVAEALSPILDTRIGHATQSYVSDGAGVSRSLSPLAAPRP